MILILLGPPGVGKGTQAKKISQEFTIPQISTGDIFRDIIKRETELGKKVKEYVESGRLVPDDLVIDVVEKRVKENDCQNGFILDGFPRTVEQAVKLDELFNEIDYTLDVVVKIEVDKKEIIERIINRRVCSNCGRIYNLISNPPTTDNICDECGGELYQREDDTVEVIDKRFSVYEKQTASLIEYYSNKNLLITINGSGPPEKVYKRIRDRLYDYT